jgi:hypothetical protein
MTDYVPPLYDHALDEDELARSLLHKRQRQQRYAFRVFLQAKLAGDPARALMLSDKFQPLLDHKLDVSLPSLPDDPDMVPPTNQDLNS